MIGINRPMPRTCGECPCNDDSWRCGVTGYTFDYYNDGFDCDDDKLPDCPLIDLTDDGK